MGVAGLALFVYVEFVKSQLRPCSSRQVVPGMPLAAMKPPATDTRLVCISGPYELVHLSLGLFL